jgi:hypothetical protein
MNYTKIWANTEDMILKHVYPKMKHDGRYKYLKDDDALAESDLDLEYLNYKG